MTSSNPSLEGESAVMLRVYDVVLRGFGVRSPTISTPTTPTPSMGGLGLRSMNIRRLEKIDPIQRIVDWPSDSYSNIDSNCRPFVMEVMESKGI